MHARDPRESGEYWKKHVMSWEAGAYYRDAGSQPRLWDGLAALFRGNGMYVRMEAALRLAAPHIRGMSVLDVGCASGRFAIQLLEAGAQRVIGLDVSPAAIEAANQRRIQSPYADRLEFRVADLAEAGLELPQVDLLTALGVIEYFDGPALERLLSKFRTRYFLLDFPDAEGRRRAWIIWNLRQVYLRIHRCPGVYLYTQEEFRRMAASHGFEDLRYVHHSIFDYVTNLPAA
jgi:cyclopropane fatty-acyl-phospholipid synthase-like methyltransferase